MDELAPCQDAVNAGGAGLVNGFNIDVRNEPRRVARRPLAGGKLPGVRGLDGPGEVQVDD